MTDLRLGDSALILRDLPDDSIDTIVTDPPFGISFMGKHWDKALPNPTIWAECLRVLKPGGSAMVQSGARTDCLWRMCRDLEEAGFELSQSMLMHIHRQGFPKGKDLGKLDERFTGWYTKGKIKPAMEFIIWARKPISERTELDNMVEHGVGGINVGACMIPYGEDDDHSDPRHESTGPANGFGMQNNNQGYGQHGRFPANVLVMDGAIGPVGSRYFDIAAWSAHHGITEDGWVEAAEAGMLQIPKASKSERNESGFKCDHPTCKPVRLMSFLIHLVCPPGGTVLDPFMGSGTTGVAAIQSGFSFIGIEMDPDYLEIARARCSNAERRE